ncbi:PAAR domain-containing protein [Endozoicomonas sp. SM1973]|uniref:PAAR domain-containing protein n=1 Tax=Spartinivicinus marinus TaxID=2994442 RepID=A0A853IGJ1_9GAMM|nr:PAAR domain-containing protein [Spartinivicinus marinus]MCX4027988.1 PAAR domain-containing protein [Spartinivicinus marinus]NYZ68265.1 PAAR domain-containing protein [Spartinivicinus marinus]
MPAATRLGDICTGHGCFPPRPSITGSTNVLINGRPAIKAGDMYMPHGCPNCPPHPGSLAAGSSSVMINGSAAGRVGDRISCGGSVAMGSSDVFIGG